MEPPSIENLPALVRLCLDLGAEEVGQLTPTERLLPVAESSGNAQAAVAALIHAGSDPLGEAYTRIVSPSERRPLGQTYTPDAIVASMVSWAKAQKTPVRVVDPGAGSGRYLLAAARAFPNAMVIGSDIDPLATLMLRANIAIAGLADRSQIVVGDYRSLALPEVDGPTLFMGNPPYVRHHQISPAWKQWLLTTAKSRGLAASGLAGLHVHFFMAGVQVSESGKGGTHRSKVRTSH